MGSANKYNYARLLPAADYVPVPWKNGGGISEQIAVFPESEPEDFEWRLSRAKVEAAGPFSLYPGYSRFLSVVEGKELVLRSNRELVALKLGNVFSFVGEDSFTCAIPKGPVRDLGLIYKREKYRSLMQRLEFSAQARSFALRAEFNFFYALEGGFKVNTYPGDITHDLATGDTLSVGQIEAAEGNDERLVLLEPTQAGGKILAVEIYSRP